MKKGKKAKSKRAFNPFHFLPFYLLSLQRSLLSNECEALEVNNLQLLILLGEPL